MPPINIALFFRLIALFFIGCLLCACTVDKLEARLQADPQCKPVMNAKTGALLPCPGTDKEFYKSIPALAAIPAKTPQAPVVRITEANGAVATKALGLPVECKPQLHQKSGSLMPCPAP
jgi:hypothetical protein